jgi:RecB family exonuclease
VDYKTGRAPREAYEASALFQMKFYALVIWRLRGQVPRLLQLVLGWGYAVASVHGREPQRCGSGFVLRALADLSGRPYCAPVP